jgi:ribosome-associated protein
MQISRSEQKRRVKGVVELVAQLANLPTQVIAHIPCSDEIRALLAEAAAMEVRSRQRHIKYVAKCMQEQPLEAVYDFISQHQGKALAAKRQLHEIELWRDALINEAIEVEQNSHMQGLDWQEHWQSQTLQEIAEKIPGIDLLGLAKLAYLFVRTRNPRHSREIYRHLRAAVDSHLRLQANKGSANESD